MQALGMRWGWFLLGIFFQFHSVTLARPPQNQLKAAWDSAAFFARWSRPGWERELAIIQELLKGTRPTSLESTIMIELSGVIKGRRAVVKVPVANDYLRIGTSQDWIRVPMTNYAAQFYASQLGMSLPTVHLVDEIYRQAQVRLSPQPTNWYKEAEKMRWGLNYILFNQTIESQRGSRTGLIAGHKKDVVVTNRLDHARNQVAIYGWHRGPGRPIQPLATPHDYTYEDYSHGIRLIGPWITVEWSSVERIEMHVVSALRDPEIGSLLNGGQGALNDVRAARVCDPSFAVAIGVSSTQCPPELDVH